MVNDMSDPKTFIVLYYGFIIIWITALNSTCCRLTDDGKTLYTQWTQRNVLVSFNE